MGENLDNRHRYKDFTTDEYNIVKAVACRSLSSPEAVVSLIRSIRYILANNIPGDFVECGVYCGGSIEVMIRTLQLFNCERQIYGYDTFDGMPQPGKLDYEYGTGYAMDTWNTLRDGDKTEGSNWVKCGIEEVARYISNLGYPKCNTYLIKGMVEDTIPKCAPKEIALARFDTDFYQSTQHEFNHLYPLIASGGVLIIDDYGAFQGSFMATEEYIHNHKLRAYLHRVDEHVRMLVKP